MRAAVIADDLTGALELGALLAIRRLRTLVTWGDSPLAPCDALVIDTRTRHLPPAEAATRVRAAAEALPPEIPLFKKIDSTLRGNVQAELAALQSLFPARPVIFTPAYPSLGRVVRGGTLYVNGVPVAQTEFGHDPRSPVTESSCPDMRDAETDADLIQIEAPASAIWAGSGGLGRVWTSRLPKGNAPAEPSRLGAPMAGHHPLLICGSRHPASLEQARRARQAGIDVVLPDPGATGPEAILAKLGQAAAARAPQALLLFGGDTAAAVLDALAVQRLWPIREVLPGIVLSRTDDGRAVITKAGGFGTPDVVERIGDALAW